MEDEKFSEVIKELTLKLNVVHELDGHQLLILKGVLQGAVDSIDYKFN